MLDIDTHVANLYMVGPTYARKLAKLGITSIKDLLYHIPFRYENYSQIYSIRNIKTDEKLTIRGKIESFENIYTKFGKKIQKAVISDNSGRIETVWYNQPYLRNIIHQGTEIALSGKAKWFDGKIVLESPEYEIVKSKTDLIHTGRIIPIYPETSGLSSKWLRTRINTVLTKLNIYIPEILPANILAEFDLMDRTEAIKKIHFPQKLEETAAARKRLAFDELLITQLAANSQKRMLQEIKAGHKFDNQKYKIQMDDFIQKLPFQLTKSQIKAILEVISDLSRDTPMNRLIEGDVGSGKTVVAAIAMYLAFLNGLKSALLAPTEILAQQHYQTVNKLLSPMGIKIALITSSTNKRKKSGDNLDADIFIGTHALLSEKIKIDSLGLIVIDEQQRFGVSQRAILRKKGVNPHVLILTATPIPRTIALTLYSDLNLSVINEMPKGRQKIKTWVVPGEKREAAYRWIEKQIKNSGQKQQAYIICPFIEESETLDYVKDVTSEYRRLKDEIFPTLSLGLLHGNLRTKAKNEVMEDFKEGKLDILVATAVIEVGIDIPNATIILIEAADRFGLAQLHQLRGRVGRSSKQSYCLLFTQTQNDDTLKRLKILENVFSGPQLAEYDLKLRGMGQIYGTRQHGFSDLKIADITDLEILEKSKSCAKLLETDNNLFNTLPLLKEEVQKYTIGSIVPD